MTGNKRVEIKKDVVKAGFSKHALTHTYPLGRTRIFGVYCSSFRVLQLISEFALLFIVLFVVFNLGGTGKPVSAGLLSMPSGLSVFLSSLIVMCMCCMGLYSSRQSVVVLELLQRLFIAFCVSIAVIAALYLLLSWQFAFIELLLAPLVAAFVVLFLGRKVIEKLVGRESIVKKVLILGDKDRTKQVFNKLYSCSGSAFSLHLLDVTADPGDSSAIGNEVIDFVCRNDIAEIVLAYEKNRQNLPMSVLLECKLSGVTILDPIEFLERESGLLDFDFLDLGWIVFADGFRTDQLGLLTKRIFDIVGAFVLLLLSIPLFVLAAAAIKLDRSNTGPIFYRQKRVGLDGKLFDVWKFRSMFTDAEADGKAQWAVENDSRVTAVGSILRKFRIDELPQLFNVLKGEMSLVGPRPERPEFVERLSELHILYEDRHRVKPGLTGWAQMRFPYTASSDDSIKKLQYDMYYVKNRSLLLDCLILLQTVEVVTCGKGAR